jgi:hypothetical protein
MLTEAVREVLPRTPDKLSWSPLGPGAGATSCYEAAAGGHLYTVNILSGVVLFDGAPLGHLPDEIRQDPLFVRTFANSDFECVVTSAGVFKTAYSIKGRYYEFSKHSALTVKEITAGTNVTLELLDSVSNTSWQGTLPVRLREQFSHWYWRERDVIVVRGVDFLDRSVSFLIYREKVPRSDKWLCRRVPIEHRQIEDVTKLHELIKPGIAQVETLKLIVAPQKLIQVLSKFEDKKYIETYHCETLIVSLPRFHREFRMSEDGLLHSTSDLGFHLCDQQQLDDTLIGFTQYLLLTNNDEMKVLVPRGIVQRSSGGQVAMKLAATFTCLEMYSYDVHPRFRCLEAPCIASRLHLACLYAATHCFLPEARNPLTGWDIAADLVRKCWLNRPLTDEENHNLQCLKSHCLDAPCLAMLCYELESSSINLSFLHETYTRETSVSLDGDAVTLYEAQDRRWNHRQILTKQEASWVLQKPGHRKVKLLDIVHAYIDIPACAVEESIVRSLECDIGKLVCLVPASDIPEFPLAETQRTALAQYKITAIRESFEAFHSLPKKHLKHSLRVSEQCLRELFGTALYSRKLVERYVLCHMDTVPESCVERRVFRVCKSSNLAPTITLVDLLRLALDRSLFHHFNPFLSEEARDKLHGAILLWMQLCVVEDRLKRLLKCCETGQKSKVLKELQVKREWDVEEHLEWLVFEVEGRLQIRPIQYRFAAYLIRSIETNETRGAIGQLNMGEGKTRVILPMLVLHFARGEHVLRLCFLSQLLGDAVSHFHRHLCASVLNRRIFVLPFNRDVQLNVSQVEAIRLQLDLCRETKGCVCVAPEHRLSLLLKRLELQDERASNGVSTAMLKLLERTVSYIDVLDESDEVLRHKYQLIYAVGQQMDLPSGASRWHAVHAVLRATMQPFVHRAEAISGCAVLDASSAPESWINLRLTDGEQLQNAQSAFKDMLARELLRDLPYEFRWISARPELHFQVFDYITNETSMESGRALLDTLGGDSKEIEDLRAFRGLLAHNVLVHCLMSRHRVNYGIKRPGKKRLAVPFRAADTPSERSEFSQPDVAIVYTTLSYYYDGLQDNELADAFDRLLKLGDVARDSIYLEWFKRSKGRMSEEHERGLDKASKIDLTNRVQFRLLIEYFHKNTGVINFWLAYIVFPEETKQYPHKIKATAWHLCNNSFRPPIGFSGTADTSLLMPLQVTQLTWGQGMLDDCEKEFAATDGKMLSLLLRHDNGGYHELQESDNVHSVWRNVCDMAISKNASALIDAGGLIVGVANREVSLYMVQCSDFKRQGVVFFDTACNEWRVLSVSGREWSLTNSPIRECEALVFFDDSRCRGSDMKLKADARGMLTVGPKMCKDKLMQAAGRMRELDQDQSIFLVGRSDVTRLLGQTGEALTSLHVLEWVLDNTIASIAPEGLLLWARQGMHFYFTGDAAEFALLDEIHTLTAYYDINACSQPLCQVVNDNISSWKKRRGEQLRQGVLESVDVIASRVSEYGAEHEIIASAFTEECERELEKEVEQEEEEECAPPAENPRSEEDWAYWEVLEEDSQSAIIASGARPLADVIKENFTLEDGAQHIAWCSKVFCTANFVHSIPLKQRFRVRLEQYLRPVDAFLLFRNDQHVLLLSEREADIILKHVWQREQKPCEGAERPKPIPRMFDAHPLRITIPARTKSARLPIFAHLFWARLAFTAEAYSPHKDKFAELRESLPLRALLSLQLFNGESVFSTEEQRSELRNMLLAHTCGKKAALSLPAIRGLQYKVARSDLEQIARA